MPRLTNLSKNFLHLVSFFMFLLFLWVLIIFGFSKGCCVLWYLQVYYRDKKHETYSQINSTSTVTPYPYNKRSYTFCGRYSQQLLYKIKTLVYYSAECVSVLSYWQCSWALGIVEKWHRAVFACIYIGGIFLTPLSVCIYESYFYFNTPVLMY